MSKAQSGVSLSDAAYDSFMDMKMKKKHRCMIMVIEEALIVETEKMEKTENQQKDFDEFVAKLPSTECRYIVLDLTVPSKTGGAGKEQLFYIAWCPDTAGIQKKMVYAASKDAFTKRVKQGTKNVQANDLTDLVYEELLNM